MRFQMIKFFNLIDEKGDLVETMPFENEDGAVEEFEVVGAVKHRKKIFALLKQQTDSSNLLVTVQTPNGLELASKEDAETVSKYFVDKIEGGLQ